MAIGTVPFFQGAALVVDKHVCVYSIAPEVFRLCGTFVADGLSAKRYILRVLWYSLRVGADVTLRCTVCTLECSETQLHLDPDQGGFNMLDPPTTRIQIASSAAVCEESKH